LNNSSILVEGARSAEENYHLLKDELLLWTKVNECINQNKTLLKFYESYVLPKTGEAFLKFDPTLDLFSSTKSNAEYVNTFLGICDLRLFKVWEFLEEHANALFKVLPKEDLIQKSLGTMLSSNPFPYNPIRALSFMHLLEGSIDKDGFILKLVPIDNPYFIGWLDKVSSLQIVD
jgi:hypothetical protein